MNRENIIVSALTTHVLDTAKGVPAAGMKVELWSHGNGESKLLKSAITNSDGRLDEPALDGHSFIAGSYELRFYAGDYFNSNSAHPDKNGAAFLDIIPICFGVSDTGSHYHVPLLVSPFSYSTYRGS